MRLQLLRETLLDPLSLVMGVVERKQTLPILSNVLVETQQQSIAVTGTDLEVELVGQAVLEQPTETHRVTLPGRKLMDICKALPEASPIELLQEDNRVILRSGKSRFTLATLPADDFPNITPQSADLTFHLPQKDILHLLQRTYFAMAQQDVRYYLNGLLLEINNGHLKAVTTDGHRLALCQLAAPIDSAKLLQLIIPRKGILELMRLLADTEEACEVMIGSNHLRITTGDFTFTSKLIEGRFPEYGRVVPKQSDKTILIDRDMLKQSLTRTAILCNEKFRGVRFELSANTLKISANNPEHETAEEELAISYDAESLEIGFNVNYLLDVLNTLPNGLVKISCKDANSSVLIEEEAGDGTNIYVIMPMRL